jgi:dolichol kinase
VEGAGNLKRINMIEDMFKILGPSTLFLILFVLSEIIFRKFRLKAEITRKITHVLSAVLLTVLPIWISLNDIKIIALLFIVVLLLSVKFKIFKSIHNVKRKTYGEILFPLGVLSVLFFTSDVLTFQAAMLILGFSDTAAELFGRQYGKIKFLNKSSSLIGSLSFFIVTFFIIMILRLPGLNTIDSVIISALLTIIEAISTNGTDNLSVPLFFSAIIYLTK